MFVMCLAQNKSVLFAKHNQVLDSALLQREMPGHSVFGYNAVAPRIDGSAFQKYIPAGNNCLTLQEVETKLRMLLHRFSLPYPERGCTQGNIFFFLFLN